MEVGLYGKLPSHGDFLRRRASDDFVERWDAWLQHCMTASRTALGEGWLQLYLTSPVWRFVCGADVAGASTVLGVMVPSVDRVGRYFPLTIVAEVSGELGVMVAAAEGAAFFEAAEHLVVETLALEDIDFEVFDAHVARLAQSLAFVDEPRPVTLEPSVAALLGNGSEPGWQVPLGSVGDLVPVWTQVLSHRLSEVYGPMSLWWTDGSTAVHPSCLVTRGLPHPDTFKSLLDGGWVPPRWRPAAATIHEPEPIEETLRAPVPMLCQSAAATDVGRVRRTNQDSFLERPEIGLWVVADGLGGHTDGDVASRMVCDALVDFELAPTLPETMAGVRQRMRDVNDHLLRMSARTARGAKIGSTVVILIIRGNECAVLWAGDSRAYLQRDAHLEQLTRDHSAALSVPGTHAESNVITRAVGVAPGLLLDVFTGEVRPGDRFLLCSDGLTRQVPDPAIEAWLKHAEIEVAVEGLIRTTLEAGAPDNVTVLVAEASLPL